MQQENYYVSQKRTIMKRFDELVRVARIVAKSRFDDKTIDVLTEKAREEFENLLPQLPDVGGAKSPFTSFMVDSGVTLAMYKACKEHRMENKEIGQWMYEIIEGYVDSISSIKKRLASMMLFSRSAKRRWKKWMAETHNRDYPENWLGDYVEGDGKTFEYGLNFTECGWLKLLRKFGAEEFAPYACLADYAKMRGIGVGFKRTQILSLGHSMCDFRFVKNHETPRGWPPENLEEFKRAKQGSA